MKSKKPSKAKLEEHLRAGALIADIARKYDASKQSVNNWIKSYGLEGIQGVKKTEAVVNKAETETVIYQSPPCSLIAQQGANPSEVVQCHEDTGVQSSPTLADLEQFHTDSPVQELPKVEMDQIKPTIGIDVTKVEGFCTNTIAIDAEISKDEESGKIMSTLEDTEMKIYSCLDCGKKFFSEEYADLCNTCYESLSESSEPITSPDPIPAPQKPFAEVWQDELENLAALKRSYVTLAQQEFKDGLLAMVAYLVG